MRFSEFDFDVITSPEEAPRPPRRGNPPQEAALRAARPQPPGEAEGEQADEDKPRD